MPRQKPKLELTLFPFLSVLAGLIAVMMLFMIVTISTRVIAAEEKEQKSLPPPRKEEESTDPADKEGIDAKRYEMLQREIIQLSGTLAQRKQQYDELARAVDQLEGLIEVKKNELEIVGINQPQKGRKLGEPTPVDVVPVADAKGGLGKRPIYVEVKATEYIVHPEKKSDPPKSFPIIQKKDDDKGKQAPIATLKQGLIVDPGLQKFMEDVNRRRQQVYLVFLIHPGGTLAFQNIRFYTFTFDSGIRGDWIDVGWEPFSRDWLYLPGAK